MIARCVYFIALSLSAIALAQQPQTAAPRIAKLIAGPDLGYRAVPDALPIPEGMENISVSAVAINSKNHILVYQRSSLPLLEFDENRKFIHAFGDGLVTRAHGLRIDSQDNLWITDVTDNTVMELNSRGKVIITLGTRGKSGEWNESAGTHYFNQPTDISFAPSGEVFISQGHGGPDPRILKFSRDGKLITQWSGKQDGPGAFEYAHSIVTDAKGNVYIADREKKRILVFDGDGRYLRLIQMESLVCGLYINKGQQLFITSGFDGQVEKMDWNGKILGVMGGGPGKEVGQFGEAHYMVMARNGDIYVADTGDRRVQKFVKK